MRRTACSGDAGKLGLCAGMRCCEGGCCGLMDIDVPVRATGSGAGSDVVPGSGSLMYKAVKLSRTSVGSYGGGIAGNGSAW